MNSHAETRRRRDFSDRDEQDLQDIFYPQMKQIIADVETTPISQTPKG
jgi:hypothetical protein